jgi:hypothetical protein
MTRPRSHDARLGIQAREIGAVRPELATLGARGQPETDRPEILLAQDAAELRQRDGVESRWDDPRCKEDDGPRAARAEAAADRRLMRRASIGVVTADKEPITDAVGTQRTRRDELSDAARRQTETFRGLGR